MKLQLAEEGSTVRLGLIRWTNGLSGKPTRESGVPGGVEESSACFWEGMWGTLMGEERTL